ncbi:hypothetical protein G6M89_03490 [Natronolimnobius sp. AArcel1]|uniref:hypothetical protein n=1 Tax=Natronolimnobius sp. AArcel1 TaxID=1679093 RepID=UPI0013EB5198|nr:hypothetical protein [Natronolimnobius sp. AArcel1]NGM68083.1 hypothetical protein [Natronolimnobius sp. AArcel1]
MSESDDQVSTEDTMRERADESRAKLWVLVGANRLLVTGVLALSFFVLFMLGALLDPTLSGLLQDRNVIESLYAQMIGSLITGVTLVVTISQLIISQENGPLGEQRTRMSETLDFRSYIQELTDKPAPADPSAFLREIVDATQVRAEALEDEIERTDNDDLKDEVNEFVDSIVGNAETVREELDGASFGTFDVVYASMDYNYSWKIFQIERLKADYGDVIDEEQDEALDDLRSSFAMFGPAREHIKTLYFQWELINLSRYILYAAIPALLVSGMMMTFVDTTTITGTILGVEVLLWLVAVTFTFTLIPFFLLTTYIMRVATAAKRTLAIGPLILRDSQR